jgi:hypothetical protein
MAEFPASPMPPSEFLEEFLPRAFAEADLPEAAKQASVKLGVRLEGEGGGEWTFQIQGGSLRVRAEPREQTALTIVHASRRPSPSSRASRTGAAPCGGGAEAPSGSWPRRSFGPASGREPGSSAAGAAPPVRAR